MKRSLILFWILIAFSGQVPALTQVDDKELLIGISESPPFVTIGNDEIKGADEELWRNTAAILNIKYRYVRFPDYISLMEALKNREIDMTINPITLTGSRLSDFRLSIPFYTSYLGLAQRNTNRLPILTALGQLINWRTLQMMMMLFGVVFIFSILIWLAESRVNPREFRKNHWGIFDGIWWAFVTMTTVGYGDKVPKSKMGRALTIIWMFYAIALFFIFTAEISSELTITKLKGEIITIEDLRKSRVGTLCETGYAAFCNVNHIDYTPFINPEDGIDALLGNKIDAFIADVANLEYLVDKYKLKEKIQVTTTNVNEQYFCFGTNRENLGLIDRINPVMFTITESAEWSDVLKRYRLD